MTEATALRRSLIDAGDKPLLFDLHGRSKSAAQLVEGVDRLAGAIEATSRARPKIGLWYRNSFAAVEAFLAVEWLGGTRIPVDPTASPDEARRIFDAAAVDLVLADRDHARELGGGSLIHDDSEPLAGKRSLPTDDTDEDRILMVYPRAVIDGELFGIPLSYRNWRAIVATNIELFRSGQYGAWDESSEVFLSAQQIMHGTGFLGTFPFLAMALPQVVADTFDAGSILSAIARHRVTATMLVPAMLKALVSAHSSTSDANSLRHLLYGGGPISTEDILHAIDRFGPVLTQVYGRVEGGWPLAILGIAEHEAMRTKAPHLARSCGRSVLDVSVRLRPLPGEPSDVGELAVKSAMTSKDYVGPDGWCSLGDVMRRDGDGYLYFERRLDRMINTGYHVYPDEIEAIVAALPGVVGVRVVGEPHSRWGEMVVAYIVSSGDIPEQELVVALRQAVARQLAKYKVPREFRVVKELPGHR